MSTQTTLAVVNLPFNPRHAICKMIRNAYRHKPGNAAYEVAVGKVSTLTTYKLIDPPNDLIVSMTRITNKYQTSMVVEPA